MGRIKQKEIKENWEEEELKSYLKTKFTGILARKKWDKDDIGDVLDLVEELLKSEKEKDRQRFIEILEKLKERWLSFSGVWTKESEPFQTGFNSAVKQTNQKIQEVIETLKDEK